jgi:exopolysaccharide biosynthesis polyprenyl glycosylphosphotransferase
VARERGKGSFVTSFTDRRQRDEHTRPGRHGRWKSGTHAKKATPGRQEESGSSGRGLHWPRGGRLRIALLVGDLTAVAVAWLVAFAATGVLVSRPVAAIGLTAFVAVLSACLAAHWGLYLARVSSVRSAELAALFRVSVIGCIGGWLAARAALQGVWWGAAVSASVLAFVFLVALRNAFAVWLKARRKNGHYCRRILLVGRDEASDELLELVLDQPELGYRVVGFVGPSADTYADFAVERVGTYADVKDAVKQQDANGVIVAASALGNWALRVSLCEMVEDGVHVQVSTGLQGLDHRRLRASTVGYEPVMYLEPSATTTWWEREAKRAMDLAIGGIGFLLALPVLVLAALAIKLDDGGPVFFRQERIGRYGTPFRLFKLRTMVVDAERRLDELSAVNERTGPLFKTSGDPRVTRVGRFLRATSIDEVPQLINVLKGEMSLVGPRPPLASEYEQFDEEHQQRQQLLPGITGLWQLEARDNPSFRTYRRLDLYYLRNWSLSLDLMILLLTVYTVVTSMLLRSGSDATQQAAVTPSEPAALPVDPPATVA